MSSGVSVDEFQALEQKVLRAVEIVKREREARAVAEAEVVSLREQLAAQAQAAESQIADVQSQIATAESLIADAESQIVTAQSNAEAIKSKAETLQREKEAAESQIAAFNQEREAVRQRVERMMSEIDELL